MATEFSPYRNVDFDYYYISYTVHTLYAVTFSPLGEFSRYKIIDVYYYYISYTVSRYTVYKIVTFSRSRYTVYIYERPPAIRHTYTYNLYIYQVYYTYIPTSTHPYYGGPYSMVNISKLDYISRHSLFFTSYKTSTLANLKSIFQLKVIAQRHIMLSINSKKKIEIFEGSLNQVQPTE